MEGVAAVEEGAEVTGTVAGAAGAWEELILGPPPGEGVTAADWLRELRKSSTGEQRGRLQVCVRVCLSHLDEELLVTGPPPPSRLASPGPARAPRPP